MLEAGHGVDDFGDGVGGDGDASEAEVLGIVEGNGEALLAEGGHYAGKRGGEIGDAEADAIAGEC